MNISSLVEFLVKSITSEPEMISVKEFDDDDKIIIEVFVSSKDMGAVIGKDGKIASAIRTITKSAAYANHLKKVEVHFNEF
jgi:hypothetical protein